MIRPSAYFISISFVVSAGCASVPASQIGQTAGTILGAAVAPGVGAPVGAAIGLLGGMLVQRRIDRRTETRERQDLSHQFGRSAASNQAGEPLAEGHAVRVWVDEMVENGRIIPAHFDVRHLHS